MYPSRFASVRAVASRWILLGAALLAARAAAAGLALMVPAYFYPSDQSDWDRLATAAARVPLVAIMNPSNGPGTRTTADPRYTRAIQAVRQAGGRVTGYVFTQYTRRPLAEVQADLRRYHDLYSLDGFFVDEMSNDGGNASVAYYAELYDYIRRLKPAYHVTGNPGTFTQEIYITRPTADTVVTFEDGTGYAQYQPSAWNRRHPAHRFCHLLHSRALAADTTNAIALAQQRNAGFLYVTDDRLPNPWDRLPEDWEVLVSGIESANRSAAEGTPPRLELKPSPNGNGQGQGRLELDGPAGRYVVTRANGPSDSEWRPWTTNLTFTGQLAWEPIYWHLAADTTFFQAVVR